MSKERRQVYSIDQHVSAKVEKVLPYGVFVRLEDGTRAYIRRRELSLDGDVAPTEVVAEGQVIEAVVLRLAEPDQSMELSHRATLPDPWEEFTRQFRKGDVVTGTVKDLVPGGAFAQIVPGVNGFIPREELATWSVERPEEVVWTGDQVEAVVTWIDLSRQRVRLSIRRWLERLSRVEPVLERLHQKAKTQTTVSEGLEEPIFPSKTDYPDGLEEAFPILVVDDSDAVRGPLVKWLSFQGCLTCGAKTAAEAMERFHAREYGLVLVDLDLPEVDGLSFIRQLRSDGHATCVGVMSSPEWIEDHLAEIETLGVADVFPKPLNLDDIQRMLLRLSRGEKPRLQSEPGKSTAVAQLQPFHELATTMRAGQPLAERFCQGLEQLIKMTRAEEAIVFHLDPISQGISIVAQAGAIPLGQDAIYSLVMSPVKDVIQEETEVWENQVSGEHTGRFRKLLDLLPFESCIGVPILGGSQVEYALFLFHRDRGVFSYHRLRDAWAMATLFAVALDRQALDKRIQAMSRIFLSGQLAAGFGHEVYNKLSGLEIRLRNVHSDFERLGQVYSGLRDSFDFLEMRQALDKTVETALDMKRTVTDFRQLMEAKEERAVDVNQVIRQAEALVRPLVRRAKVDLRLDLGQKLPPAIGSTVGLQQVFLNLMLNAVQHMEQKPDDRRVLEVATAYEGGHGDRPIKVRFSDTGPGIHRQLWEKVFALGFTTKPGGSGLGLYIARSLVESMRGEILVERSVIPIGTTFLIELPVSGSQERSA